MALDLLKEKLHELAADTYSGLWKRMALFCGHLSTHAIFWSFLCIAGLIFWSIAALNARVETQVSSLAYEALTCVAVPARTAHPKYYRNFLKYSISRNSIIRLDFVEFWKNLSYGHIELKDGMVLEEIFTGQAYGFGQKISIDFDWTWKLVVLRKLVSSYSSFRWEHVSGSKSTVIPNLESCLVNNTLDLDFIPLPFIRSALAVAQNQLKPNETFEVEFTSLSPKIGFMSYQYLLCAAILLPNRQNISTSKKTTLPFLTALPEIIDNFKASSTVIQSVKDVSSLHAEALESHAEDMVHDKWMRSSFVARHGMDAWRETRLRLKWEAALLKNNMIVRWKITMSRAKQT